MNLIPIKNRIMKGLRSIPKILKINGIVDYKVSCLFNNGESRWIDFKSFFEDELDISNSHPAKKLVDDIDEFNKLELIGNSIGWKNTGVYSKDFEGKEQFYFYHLDPIILFNYSNIDESRSLKIGETIKRARKKAGLTQSELALRSGTSKHYISKLENRKSDIELLTLKKIIEAGLGKKLNIQIS